MKHIAAAVVFCSLIPCRAQDAPAEKILDASGVRGGLVVYIGPDAERAAGLRGGGRCLVQMLCTDATAVEAARRQLRDRGICGPVSATAFDGAALPYVDNLVNLAVVGARCAVTAAELNRVLAPGGTAMVAPGVDIAGLPAGGGNRLPGWKGLRKPVDDERDEWTHYYYDAGGNPVSRDTIVGPPHRLQWVGSPRWARHHDHLSSFNAMVSAGGRIFYIFDEGPTSAIQLPPDWRLTARDAYNGTVLWRRRIENWNTHVWQLKSGPAQLPRRLVAAGERVYVTPGLGKPVVALDAATGETVRTYAGTAGTEEIIFSRGVLLAVIDPAAPARPWSTQEAYASIRDVRRESERWQWRPDDRRVTAIDAETGTRRWQVATPVAPMTLAADAERVFLHDGTRVVCLGRSDGETRWQSKPLPRAEPIRSWFGPRLLVGGGVVVFAGGEKIVRHRGGKDTMTALDAKTGKALWTAPHPPSGYDSPEDVFVVDGLVWTAPTTNRRDSGRFTARKLQTGKVVRSFPADDGNHMPHHRCHSARATEQYILASRTGIEYVDLAAGHWNRNDWVRGACLYGIMPANGLTYAPYHSCACYILAKLNGFNALATRRGAQRMPVEVSDAGRLERGPAGDAITAEVPAGKDDWPTYRRDPSRSGSTPAAVPAQLAPAWKSEIGGRLSALTVARGRVYAAAVDVHTLHAIDAASGETAWTFTAGARIDSPPTVWRGRVLFGAADGRVYCLRAADGRPAWRFRAAPRDRRMTAWEQVESAWPVHGGVLVLEEDGGGTPRGIVYAVAGRSLFLDGGLRLLRLDARSGAKISENVMTDRHPETGKPLDAKIAWPDLPTALPDILSCDGTNIYMRAQRFDRAGNRVAVAPPGDFKKQAGAGAHLFCPTGFLDDAWWHRSYWLWGKNPGSAAGRWYAAAYHAPVGRIMSVSGDCVYAFGRTPQHFRQTTSLEYHLFRAKKEPKVVQTGKRRKRWHPDPHRPVCDWSIEIPLLGRALLVAGGRVFVAGPPDLVDTRVTQRNWGDAESQKRLAAQAAALAGKKGGLLNVYAAADGTAVSSLQLASPPVFDGLAAAGGRLYLAAVDGSVVCLQKR